MRQYFATLPKDELGPKLQEKVKLCILDAQRSGRAQKEEKSEAYYYGRHQGEMNEAIGGVTRVGDNGELAAFSVNHYRNLIKHILALTTSTKPSFDTKAKNTDVVSLQQTRLASNILDSYLTDKRLGRHMVGAAERSLVMAKGFVYMKWDPSLGKPYATQVVTDKDGQPIVGSDGQPKEKIVYEGEPVAIAKSPRDIVYDPGLKDWTENKWIIVRSWANRWDLAARHGELEEEIVTVSSVDQLDEQHNWQRNDNGDDDLIPMYEFYHLKTDALPNGRYTKFLPGGLVLFDGATPYQKLPVFRITPGEQFDSAEGYTDAYDIMALQEVVNVLYSIPFTNQQALGVQFIHLPQGCELSETMFKGLAVLKGGAPGTEPKGLNLTSTAAEVFNNINKVENSMEKIIGINATVRGDPDHNLKSSVALGRMQAMAIQFASNFQKSWAELQEDVGTFLFDLLKDFAKTERVTAMSGKSNRGSMLSFTGDDLSEIDRVEISLGNPLARTAAGRLELADKFYEKGEINAKQYMQVASTGQIDTIFESAESELELIRKENENLMDGMPVKAMVGDLHLAHAKEHKTVINDPHLRDLAANGDQSATAIIQAVTMHIMEHEQLHATQTPFYTMMSGEPPPPPPQQMPPPPGGPPPGPGGPIEAGAPPPPPVGPNPDSAPPPIPELPPELSNQNM